MCIYIYRERFICENHLEVIIAIPEDRIALLINMDDHADKLWETHVNIPKKVIRRLIGESMAIALLSAHGARFSISHGPFLTQLVARTIGSHAPRWAT